MRSIEQHYDFLPDGWYFTYDKYDYDGYTKLFTSSGITLAWKRNKSSFDYLQIIDGMGHELEFVKSLFEEKELRDQIEFDMKMAERDARIRQDQQESLEKVKKDFENINRPQPAVLSLSESSKDLDTRIRQFKQKWF